MMLLLSLSSSMRSALRQSTTICGHVNSEWPTPPCPLTTHPERQWYLLLIDCCHQGNNLLATSHSADGREHLRLIQDWTRRHILAPATTGIQVVEAVIHLHERVMEDTQMGLDVLHSLPMLVHELIEVVLGRTTSGNMLFQSLERLVCLVELDRKLELVEVKKKADVLDAQGSRSSSTASGPWCHGMTFFWTSLSLYSPVPVIILGLIPFPFAYFHTLDIKKAKPKGIHWMQTTRKDYLLLMRSWHLPPINDVPALSQLLHEIGVLPVHHDLRTG